MERFRKRLPLRALIGYANPPRQLEKGLRTEQAEINTFSNLDSLRLVT